MKKISFLFAVILMVTVAFFSSCGTDTTAVGPNMDLKGGAGYTSADVSVTVGSDVTFGVTAQKGDAKLVNLKIVATSNNIPTTLLDSTFSSDSFSNDYAYTPTAVGVVRISIVMKDKDGLTDETSFNVTATAGSGPITAYSAKVLGSYDNATYGSSFASADGTVYMLADAKTNAAKIDWMYYYGATNLATIASPKDASVTTIYTGTNGPANWSVRNDTKFAKVTLTAGVTWDLITNDAEIVAKAAGITETKANTLTVGQIIAFKTVAGKMGLIKVTAISGTTAGFITYDVKVQQ